MQLSGGTIALPSTPYHPSVVSSPGRITGHVAVPELPDEAIPDKDRTDCGNADAAAPVAVVWLADVREGVALPRERREVMSYEHCHLGPRVTAVVVGTTVNLRNEDATWHWTAAVAEGGDTLSFTRFTGAVQVMPDDRLAKVPGLVELRCAQHPWTKAYVLVFDHPYFAVTDAKGRFTIEGVPAGRHRMMVWSPGVAAPAESTVDVTAGGQAAVELGGQ